MPRAKQRTSALRDRMLDTAMSILARDGVAAFTTRHIAREADTSLAAVYELFGDKAGLVRAVFFEGFRMLGRHFEALPETGDPRADVVAVIHSFRRFVQDNPVVFQVMFSRPIVDFDPGPDEIEASGAVREFIVGRVQGLLDAGDARGNATDIAHVLLALAQGLAAQEAGGWLGTSEGSRDRRWTLSIETILDGLAHSQPG